jgi:hypothetical protein
MELTAIGPLAIPDRETRSSETRSGWCGLGHGGPLLCLSVLRMRPAVRTMEPWMERCERTKIAPGAIVTDGRTGIYVRTKLKIVAFGCRFLN